MPVRESYDFLGSGQNLLCGFTYFFFLIGKLGCGAEKFSIPCIRRARSPPLTSPYILLLIAIIVTSKTINGS